MLETSRTHGLLKVIVPLSLILSYGPWPFPEKFTLSKQPLIFCYPSPPSMEKILLIKSVSPFPLHPWRKSSGSPFPLHPWRKSSSKSMDGKEGKQKITSPKMFRGPTVKPEIAKKRSE
ncbi:hypothetical protein CK203_031306 [Vitis vinifera]|uniref:Uncharacterized protein n=1 Tax=Vitis vinifera TaxID=29760 RepID=A0A438IX73_VITVI|nr:hypothetical protein CK203_031306 [Vitis vinifera]